MARYVTEALVVRAIPFAETSQVVHLATEDHGLVAALAKGARRTGAAFQGGLSLLAFGTAELSRRAGADLELLLRFRHRARLRGLGRDLDRYLSACYVVDLLRTWMVPALPAPALWRAGLTVLAQIDGAPSEALPGWVAWFEARAVAATGSRPRLDACAVCERPVGGDASFSPPAGGLVHQRCAPPGPRRALDAAAREALVRFYTARLEDLVHEPPAPAAVRAVRALHDLWIPHLLERRPATLEALPRP